MEGIEKGIDDANTEGDIKQKGVKKMKTNTIEQEPGGEKKEEMKEKSRTCR